MVKRRFVKKKRKKRFSPLKESDRVFAESGLNKSNLSSFFVPSRVRKKKKKRRIFVERR